MRRQHEQAPTLAIGLKVDAGDDTVALQEWKDVAAPATLLARDEDLEAVFEAEQALAALARPDELIERRDERSGLEAAR